MTPGRLELPTRSLGNCCSIHLSYGATLKTMRLVHAYRFLQPILTHWNIMASFPRLLKGCGMKTKKTRYQQGSIRKVARARGFAWEVRFSTGKVGGKQTYKSSFFNSSDYPTEASVRKALETTVVLTNSETGRVKVDAPFSEIIGIYRTKHLPGLEHSTQQTNSYFLNSYIEPKFSKTKTVDHSCPVQVISVVSEA